MTTEQLDQIAARAEKATPGPWHDRLSATVEDCHYVAAENGDDITTAKSVALDFHFGWTKLEPENATFIAAAREDVPSLVAFARELLTERDALRVAFAEASHNAGPAFVAHEELNRLRARLRTIHDECAPYADGSETAPIHDKLCARITHLAKL